MTSNKNWIKGMHLVKGGLHKDLGIPIGEKIPQGRLHNAANQGGKVGRRARVAITLEGLKK